MTRRAKTAPRQSEMIQTMFFSNDNDVGGASTSSSKKIVTQEGYTGNGASGSGERDMDLDSNLIVRDSLVSWLVPHG